jgi:hypothetical protein
MPSTPLASPSTIVGLAVFKTRAEAEAAMKRINVLRRGRCPHLALANRSSSPFSRYPYVSEKQSYGQQREKVEAVAYIRTSSAANVGAD